MKTSKMAEAVTPSLTRKLFNMALDIGDDVINLTLGDPDLLPPEAIRKAACMAIMEGKTRYSANAGLEEARKKYAAFFKEQYGYAADPKKNIIVTVGGMEALFLTFASTLDVGDEVIVFGPYYVNYVQMIKMCGAVPIIIDRLNQSQEEVISELEKRVSEKTVAVIINSPSNPCGDILPHELLEKVAEIAVEKDLLVISDDVYNSLVYDGNHWESITKFPGMAERTVVIDSLSKRFAMTGWRLGFAVGPETLIANMTKMQENVAACAPLPSQYAAICAYDGTEYSYIRDVYQKRRDLVCEMIAQCDKLSCKKPEATFYCLVDISKTGMDCETFAYELLEKAHVAVVPATSYGEEYKSYVRIAFTLDESKLTLAMRRMTDFCNSL